MASVTKGATSFTGVEATITNAALLGVERGGSAGLGDGEAQSDQPCGWARIDWTATTLPANGPVT